MIKNLGRNKLGRTSSHRRAMLRNMATSLFLHERVTTTVAKAKELRSYAEKLITKAKKGKHLEVRKEIHDKVAYKKLFDVLADRYKTRPGGYTQILKLGERTGDNASQGLVRLVT
ncbi:MAG: 50S ribosomal protein L17 [Elusimicrobia bacterium]|nr:MAG: 50S ribosomal protein L17 [Elusimicrobiota bacterium]